jgi:hypothetical protein
LVHLEGERVPDRFTGVRWLYATDPSSSVYKATFIKEYWFEGQVNFASIVFNSDYQDEFQYLRDEGYEPSYDDSYLWN